MTTYQPLVQYSAIVLQLDSSDSLGVTSIDTATLTLTGNLTVTSNVSAVDATLSGDLAVNGGSITSSTGTLNIDNEHLLTTGNVTAANLILSSYITGYGGSPASGERLEWVTANNRFETTAAPTSSDFDHGALQGLGDDDHTQYSLATGTRAFTGTVVGVDPTAAQHLTTKTYVDGQISNIDPTTPSVYNKSAFFNGTFRESFDFRCTANATVITGTLEQSGGGDLTMQFSDGETVLDCTPNCTINIPPGTNATPIAYYVYIEQSTKTLTINTTAWPSAEHIKVTYIYVPSASFVQTSGGAYVNQNWNDHLAGTDEQGHLTHITQKIRTMGADWFSGIAGNGTDTYFTTPNTGNTFFSCEAGVVSQMHPHTFVAHDSTTDVILAANDPDGSWNGVNNLQDLTKDSTGTSLGNNKHFTLIFWGIANKGGQYSGLVCNLPGGTYSTQVDAEEDLSGYNDYSVPRQFNIDSGTAFLICAGVFKKTSTSWVWESTTDLRGKIPNNTAGSSGGGGTSDHGALSGLADDDHTQYVLVAGTRAMTGNLTVPGVNTATIYTVPNNNIDILPSGTGAIRFQTYGNTRGIYANDLQHGGGTAVTQVASGQYSTLGGGYSNTGSGYMAVIAGGRENTANGNYAAVCGGYQCVAGPGYQAVVPGGSICIASGDYSSVTGGNTNTANGDSATVAGGYLNVASGSRAATLGGTSHIASGDYSVIVGGNDNTATNAQTGILAGGNNDTQGDYSAILGGRYNTVTSNYAISHGYYTENPHWGSHMQAGGRLTNNSDTCAFRCVLGGTSNSGNSGTLYLDSSGASEEMTMPSHSAWNLAGHVSAVTGSGNEAVGYRFTAGYNRGTTSAPTLIAGTTNPIYSLDFEDHADFNVALSVSGNSIRIGVAQPVGWGDCKWAAIVDIVQVIGEP